MHGRGSARAEIVCSNVFWSKSESSCSNSNGLSPEDRDDVQGTNRAEPVVGVRVVAERGGPHAPMFVHVEEDFDSCLNRAGYFRL